MTQKHLKGHLYAELPPSHKNPNQKFGLNPKFRKIQNFRVLRLNPNPKVNIQIQIHRVSDRIGLFSGIQN